MQDAQLSAYEPAGLRGVNADDTVNAFGDQVDKPVSFADVKLNRRVPIQKFRQ